MVPEIKIRSLIEQSRHLDPDCEQSSSFIFINNKTLAQTDKENKGWKLHISVAIEDLEKAFELIASIVHAHFYRFKVSDFKRYEFFLSNDKHLGCSYGTFAVTDCGDSIQYRLASWEGFDFVEVLDKAGLGLPADMLMTPDSLEAIQELLLKNAAAKGHINPRNIIGLLIHKHSKRFVKGAQITIPLIENSDNVPYMDIAPLIQQISQILASNGVRPGERPVSDVPIKDTPYFSIRNSCFVLGEWCKDAYISASEVGSLYNPALRSNPYAHLIPEEHWGSQNIVAHCKTIIDTLGSGDFRQKHLSDILIIYSFLHQHLNLNLLGPDEDISLLLNQIAMGDFSYPDSHELWKEGHKTNEICKELQGIGIFDGFRWKNIFTSREDISFSNRLAEGNLRLVFDLIEQKESPDRIEKPGVSFEEYYLKSTHYMNFSACDGDEDGHYEMSEQEKVTYLLNAIKAWPSYRQQLKQYGYDVSNVQDKLWDDVINTNDDVRINTIDTLPPLPQWFFDQINELPVENNAILQIYLIKRYLGDSPFGAVPIAPSLEKVLLLIVELILNDIAQVQKYAVECLVELQFEGLIDKQGKPCPYKIDKDGRMEAIERPAAYYAGSSGDLRFFRHIPGSTSSDSDSDSDYCSGDEYTAIKLT